jgi:hypothetical protein
MQQNRFSLRCDQNFGQKGTQRQWCYILIKHSYCTTWYIRNAVQNQHVTHTTEQAAQLINTVKPQHKKDRMKYNTMSIITTYLEKNYWQTHSAVDFVFNSVLPETCTHILIYIVTCHLRSQSIERFIARQQLRKHATSTGDVARQQLRVTMEVQLEEVFSVWSAPRLYHAIGTSKQRPFKWLGSRCSVRYVRWAWSVLQSLYWQRTCA